jgi:hypothetical protein
VLKLINSASKKNCCFWFSVYELWFRIYCFFF